MRTTIFACLTTLALSGCASDAGPGNPGSAVLIALNGVSGVCPANDQPLDSFQLYIDDEVQTAAALSGAVSDMLVTTVEPGDHDVRLRYYSQCNFDFYDGSHAFESDRVYVLTTRTETYTADGDVVVADMTDAYAGAAETVLVANLTTMNGVAFHVASMDGANPIETEPVSSMNATGVDVTRASRYDVTAELPDGSTLQGSLGGWGEWNDSSVRVMACMLRNDEYGLGVDCTWTSRPLN